MKISFLAVRFKRGLLIDKRHYLHTIVSPYIMLINLILKEIKKTLKNETIFIYDCKKIHDDYITYTFYKNKNSLEVVCLDVTFDIKYNSLIVELSNISNELLANYCFNLDYDILNNFNNLVYVLKK